MIVYVFIVMVYQLLYQYVLPRGGLLQQPRIL